MRDRRGARRWVAAATALLLAVAASIVAGTPARAHTPHDDVFGVAVSPSFADDGTAIVVARGIAYRTLDGGATWDRLVAGLTNVEPLSSAAVTCCDAPTYLVSSPEDGIFRSSDGGDTWRPADDGLDDRSVLHLVASPDVADLAFALTDDGLVRTTDGGTTWVPLDVPGGDLTAVALSPGRADEVLVGTAAGEVHRSDDLGETWTTAGHSPDAAVRALVRTRDGALLVGTDLGLVRADAEGEEPTAVELPGADRQPVSSIVVAPRGGPQDGDVVWVSLADQGTWRSDDGGDAWDEVTGGLTRSTQADDAGFEDRPHFGDVVVAPAAPGDEPTVLLAGFDGLFLLDPGASRWHEAELMRSRIVVGLAVSPDDADDATVVVTTYMNGASRSTDGGDTWVPINDGIVEEALYARGEDRFARLFGVALSPDFAEDRSMVAMRWTDALASGDAGERWDPVVVVPGDDPPLQQFALVWAPGDRPGSSVVLTGSRDGGIHRSVDDGRTYELVGQVDGTVRSIVAVPGAPGRFLAATQRGVFASDDAGETWTELTDAVRNTVNLAPSPAFADDGVAFAGTRRGLWSTTDGGATWSQATGPAAVASGFVEGVAVSPAFADDGLVLASVRGRGLFRSTDGGATFSPIATSLADDQLELSNYPNATAVPLVFSPTFADDCTVFGYSGDEVLRSVDGGETWTTLDLPVATHPPVAAAAGAPAATAGGGGADVGPAVAGGVLALAVAVGAAGLAVAGRRRRRQAGSEP